MTLPTTEAEIAGNEECGFNALALWIYSPAGVDLISFPRGNRD
jgi:hypothetical protein